MTDDDDDEVVHLPPVNIPDRQHIVHRDLSESQQERLKEYLDEQLMHINRKFIKRHNDEDVNVEKYLSLKELLIDFNRTLDVLWYSIASTEQSFGQSFYLLRMADDLITYFEGFYDRSIGWAIDGLTTCQKLDMMFTKLLDSKQFTPTDKVRLQSIAQRTRVSTTRMIVDSTENTDQQDLYDELLAKVYEGVLDHTA